MNYSMKEKNWIIETYKKGYRYDDIVDKHNRKFTPRTKYALQKFISRNVFGKD